MRFYAALLLLFGRLLQASAQLPEYQAQVFGEEHGIGGGMISDIFVDQEQFVWISTPSVLQRFDGRNVRQYTFDESIIFAICDASGGIWVQAAQSIWHSSTNQGDFKSVRVDTSRGMIIRGIFQMKNAPVCLLTTKGILAWNQLGGHFDRINREIPIPRNRASITRMDTSGNTLFYPDNRVGICAYDFVSGDVRKLPFTRDLNHLLAVTPDLAILTDYLQDSYWFDFKRGEIRLIDAKQYGLSDKNHKINIFGCCPLGGNRFLVNTKFGLCEYNLNTDRFERKRIYAGGKPVEEETALQRTFLDANGTAWAFTVTHIIAFKPSSNSLGLLRNYHLESDQQWDNRIYGVAEGRPGEVWFGGVNGFKRLDLNTGEMKVYPNVEGAKDRLSHFMVRGIAWDGKNVIVGPTFGGMWIFDPVTERYRRPLYASDSVHQKLEGDFIDYIGRMRNGDHIACGRFYLFRIRAGDYRAEFIHFPGDRNNMNTVTQDSKGRVWLGTERGIICLDENYKYLFSNSLNGMGTVFKILQKGENEFLIGARKALLRLTLSGDSMKVDTIHTPCDGFNVTGIFRDTIGRFWICAHNGLFLTDSTFSVFRQFDFGDNIQSKLFNDGALARLSNGMEFLGGFNGINYFYPERISMADQPLTVSIQSLSINDGDTVLHAGIERLRLPYWQNTLRFEIVAPYYNNAAKVQYRYRLSRERTGAWIEIGANNFFRLPELPAGNYTLEVAASLNGKVWYQAQKSLQFTILPPFWNTWWFMFLVGITLIGLILLLVRYRENKLQEHQAQQLEVEKLRSTALQYELETQQVIHYFSQAIHGHNTVEEALWDVAHQCISRLGWEDCVIYLLDETRNVLVQKAAWGDKSTSDQHIVNPIEIPLGRGIVGTVALDGQAERIGDTSQDQRYIVDDTQRCSELTVPILLDGRVIGVIDSEHHQKNFYTPWHLQILTAIAALCSNKIAVVRAEEARQRALLESIDNQRKTAEAKLQSLRLQMNPHFLFNALNSIQQMTLSGKSDGAALYLSKFSKLLRLVLAHSDQDMVSLREEIEMLHLYLELEALRFDDTFVYTIECEKGLDTQEYKIPTLLIQPFVENAIWHGLLHKDGKRRLYVSFYTDEEENLYCNIEDNGVGRVAAAAYQRNQHHGMGKGMSVSQERIQTLNMREGGKHSLDIMDLYNNKGEASGTRVVLKLA